MSARNLTAVAFHKMTELEMLIAAKRQATWQKFKAAGQHKKVWFQIIDIQDGRIKALEREISGYLEIPGFRARRGWGK